MAMIDAGYLTKEIKSFGAKLGFSHVGIAPPDVTIWGERFKDWLTEGFDGEMQYMRRNVERRTDPFSLFPQLKSIIVVSMNYFPGEKHRECLDNSSLGYVAGYALNQDYHPLVKSRLKELLEFIKRLTSDHTQGKIYVDSGPVLEKALAVMSGIGWMGENTLLISHDMGSWLLLGVLLLNVELEPDMPVIEDRCGECMACIDACPTSAIVSPRILDARRCISYLLGELKDSIPLEMRPLIGNRILGCDDCQWACPWNEAAGVSNETAFKPKDELLSSVLLDLMEVSEDRFSRMFNNNPVERIKRRRFLRNVAVAIGNSRDRRAVPVLEKKLSDPDPIIKEHVEWALERIA